MTLSPAPELGGIVPATADADAGSTSTPHASDVIPAPTAISSHSGARMIYHAGAIAVALLHLAFIVFVVAGGFLALRWKQVAWIHLPAALWGAAIEFGGWYCPLTGVELALRQKAGEAGYSGGFVSHYLFSLIYPAGLTRGFEIAIGLFVLALNVSVYVRVFR